MPVQQRLDILNNVIKGDFSEKITMDMLNSKEQIGIKLKPEVEAELNDRQTLILEQANIPLTMDGRQVQLEPEDRSVAHVDGNALYELNEGKAWYREGKHGREVNVDDIKVEPVRNEKGEIEKDAKGEAKYRMTAVINGESISHEITQKQYDKFMAIDDYHRMLTHDFHHHSGPSIFMEHHGPDRPHVYFKPGVDSPQELASRAFDAGLNAGEHGVGLGHTR